MIIVSIEQSFKKLVINLYILKISMKIENSQVTINYFNSIQTYDLLVNITLSH